MSEQVSKGGNAGHLLVAMWVGLVAALGSGLCAVAGFQPWLLFLGWCAFSTGGGAAKGGAQAIACVTLGIVLGMVGATVLASIHSLGTLALIIVVFFLATIAMLSMFTPPVNSIIGYFLGMTGYFASHLEPGAESLAMLAAPVAFGGACGWVAAHFAHKIHSH